MEWKHFHVVWNCLLFIPIIAFFNIDNNMLPIAVSSSMAIQVSEVFFERYHFVPCIISACMFIICMFMGIEDLDNNTGEIDGIILVATIMNIFIFLLRWIFFIKD